MTWEWEHRSNGRQWVVTVIAAAGSGSRARPVWQATIEQTTVPYDQYASQTYPEAVDARTWCLRKIAELAGAAS